MAIQVHPSFAIHAGDWLRTEIVQAYGLSVTRAADLLKVSRQAMSNLLNGHADLTAEMALRFEKAFGVRAETLMRMQLRYNLAQARTHEDELRVERYEAA